MHETCLREFSSPIQVSQKNSTRFWYMYYLQETILSRLRYQEQHLTKETISEAGCKTILTKLRKTFENAFNSEFKARMQKYTRFDAQSLYDAMIFNKDSIGKYMLEITFHQQRTPQLLKQKKLMQTQENHSNPIPALNVDSLKVDLVVIYNTCLKKEEVIQDDCIQPNSCKGMQLDLKQKDVHAIKTIRCITEKKDAWHIFDLFITPF
ncbi:hypothetical protein Tco_0837561 [Tanacetum coccineum]